MDGDERDPSINVTGYLPFPHGVEGEEEEGMKTTNNTDNKIHFLINE